MSLDSSQQAYLAEERGGAGPAGPETTLSPGDVKARAQGSKDVTCAVVRWLATPILTNIPNTGDPEPVTFRRTSFSQLCVTCWDLGVWP